VVAVLVNTILQVIQRAVVDLVVVVLAADSLAVVMADHQEQEQPDKVTMVQDLVLLGIQVVAAVQVQRPRKQAVRLDMAA
jgi:hypothetical protein